MSLPVQTVMGSSAATTESSSSAVHWGPIFAGALTASAVTLLMMLLGSGFGLTMVSPWSSENTTLTTFAVSTAIWLIVVQWLSSGLGGYLTGRLRTKWTGVHTDEVFFRDTAHGFLAWAMGTLLVAGVLGSVLSATIGAGVQAASTVAAGATSASGTVVSSMATDPMAPLVDGLLRPLDPTVPRAGTDDATALREVSGILVSSVAAGEVSSDNRAYLAKLVASKTGVSEADANARIDSALKAAVDAKVAAQEAADTARKATATFAFVAALSLLIGAFIASVSAALGGSQRDDYDKLRVAER